MANSRQSATIFSPSSKRPTKRTRSSITEHSFQGITPSPKGKKCHPCVRYKVSPMSQAAQNQRTYLRKPLTVASTVASFRFSSCIQTRIFQACRGKTDMAHYTLIARINTGDGKFPFFNVQFSKNHRPIPIEGATYYLRPSSSGKRTPIKIGKDVAIAHTSLIRMEDG